MAELRIGEVAARSGIAASAIRYYESEGLISRPLRRSGRRVYDPSVLGELALVERAKRAGFTLAEIRRLRARSGRRAPPGPHWRVLARAKRAELDARIAEAERMKELLEAIARCRCPSLADCSRALERSR